MLPGKNPFFSFLRNFVKFAENRTEVLLLIYFRERPDVSINLFYLD
jgi:hypothetical protein